MYFRLCNLKYVFYLIYCIVYLIWKLIIRTSGNPSKSNEEWCMKKNFLRDL